MIVSQIKSQHKLLYIYICDRVHLVSNVYKDASGMLALS